MLDVIIVLTILRWSDSAPPTPAPLCDTVWRSEWSDLRGQLDAAGLTGVLLIENASDSSLHDCGKRLDARVLSQQSQASQHRRDLFSPEQTIPVPLCRIYFSQDSERPGAIDFTAVLPDDAAILGGADCQAELDESASWLKERPWPPLAD